MSRDIPPAIVRDYGEADRLGNDGDHPELIGTPYDGVSFTPGWGDSGYKIQVVEYECPDCGFDRMVRRHDVSGEVPDSVRYWCLYPNCSHFVADTLSHACHNNYPQRPAREPVVFE